MIRNAVDMEFHLPGGIVCVHAHIYTDTVQRSKELEHEVEGYLRDLLRRLKAGRDPLDFGPRKLPERKRK